MLLDHIPSLWARAVIIVGVVYFVVGFGFARLGNLYLSDHVVMWRFMAWLVSGVVFAAHIGYERFRLRNSPGVTALHAAMAVAVGAFLLAVAATVNVAVAASHAPFWRYLLALVLWPMFTAVPAFLVAFIAAAILGRLPMRRWSQ